MTDIQSVTDDVPCGCGPTAEEARTLRGGITRRRALSAGAIGVFLAATGASLAPSAFAAEYPTWDDVEKARNNEAAKGAEVTRIQGLIRSLEQDVDTKQAEADRLGQEHVLALEAYEDAVARAESLSSNRPTPRVSSTNCSDGGYLVTLKNAISVRVVSACSAQAVSP